MLKRLRKYHWVSLFVAFIVVNNIVAVTFSLANAYYIVMAAALGILLMRGGVTGFKGLYAVFVLICGLSIVFNDVPEVFHPWMRYLTFIFVMGLTSPMIQSPLLRRFRRETFVLIQYLLLLVTIISFFATLGGYNSMHLAAGRTGITVQVMIMGPVAAMTLVFCAYQVFVQKTRKLKAVERGIYLFGMFCGFAMNLMAVSRIGVVAAVMGCVGLIVYKSRFKMGRAMVYAGVIVAALAATYPLWNSYSADVVAKNELASETVGMLDSRMNNWQQRLSEFESSPWIGIGFGAVDMGDDNVTEVNFKGGVETGSGWLLVLSMTGIFGFALFVIFFIKAFLKSYRMVCRRFVEPYCLLGAFLFLFGTHMLAEGYSLAAGGMLFFNLWLLLGTIDCWPAKVKTVRL